MLILNVSLFHASVSGFLIIYKFALEKFFESPIIWKALT